MKPRRRANCRKDPNDGAIGPNGEIVVFQVEELQSWYSSSIKPMVQSPTDCLVQRRAGSDSARSLSCLQRVCPGRATRQLTFHAYGGVPPMHQGSFLSLSSLAFVVSLVELASVLFVLLLLSSQSPAMQLRATISKNILP